MDFLKVDKVLVEKTILFQVLTEDSCNLMRAFCLRVTDGITFHVKCPFVRSRIRKEIIVSTDVCPGTQGTLPPTPSQEPVSGP